MGEYIASDCLTCHKAGDVETRIPPITGWDAETMKYVLNAFRARELESEVMQTVAGPMGDDEISAVAAYLATLPEATEVE